MATSTPTALEVLKSCELFPEQWQKDDVEKILQSLDLTSELSIRFLKVTGERDYYIVRDVYSTPYYMYRFHLCGFSKCSERDHTVVKLYDADQLFIKNGIWTRVNLAIKPAEPDVKIDQHTVASYDRVKCKVYLWNWQFNTCQFGVVRLSDTVDQRLTWFDMIGGLAQSAIAIYNSEFSSQQESNKNDKFHFMELFLSNPKFSLTIEPAPGTELKIYFHPGLATYFLSWTSWTAWKAGSATASRSCELEVENGKEGPKLVIRATSYPLTLSGNSKFTPVHRKEIYTFMKENGLTNSNAITIVESVENPNLFYIRYNLNPYCYAFQLKGDSVGDFEKLCPSDTKLIDAGIRSQTAAFLLQNNYRLNPATVIETTDNSAFYIWEKKEKYMVFATCNQGIRKYTAVDLDSRDRMGELMDIILRSTIEPTRCLFIEALLNIRNRISVPKAFPFVDEPDAEIVFTRTTDSPEKYSIRWGQNIAYFKIMQTANKTYLYKDDDEEEKKMEVKPAEKSEVVEDFPHRDKLVSEYIVIVEKYLAEEIKKARANQTYTFTIGKGLHRNSPGVIGWIQNKCVEKKYGWCKNNQNQNNEYHINLLG